VGGGDAAGGSGGNRGVGNETARGAGGAEGLFPRGVLVYVSRRVVRGISSWIVTVDHICDASCAHVCDVACDQCVMRSRV